MVRQDDIKQLQESLSKCIELVQRRIDTDWQQTGNFMQRTRAEEELFPLREKLAVSRWPYPWICGQVRIGHSMIEFKFNCLNRTLLDSEVQAYRKAMESTVHP